MTRFFLLCIGILFLFAAPARSQSTVTVIGAVTPGDCIVFNSTTVIKDAGITCGGGGSGVPGGANGQVQFNNSGAFGGLTNAQLTALVQQFSSTLSGVVPASGGGSVNFLRADGNFSLPPNGGAGCTVFNSTTTGCAPASGGGTANFLRADGTFAAPPFVGYGGIFDAVKTYGADPTGVSNSQTAINNAIAAACAAGVRGIVWIQPGTYLVNGGINATNISAGCTINGGGLTGTVLTVSSSTNAILDMTGSSAVSVNNLQISDPSGFASYGMLISTSGSPSHPCNVNHFRGISITGHWTQAGIYIYDCSDSSFENSQVSCFNTAAPACVYHTATNDLGAFSNFTTIITGTTQSGDWTFKSFEIHDLSHVSGASTVVPYFLSGSFSPVRYIGGIIAGSASSQGCVTLAGGVKGVTFLGVQMYGDNGTPCVFAFYGAANVTGLVIQGSAIQYGTALFSQNNAILWTGLNETGNSFSGGSLFTPSGSTGLLTQSFIDAKGLAINMGAGGTVTHSVFTQPGTITAGTQASNGSF